MGAVFLHAFNLRFTRFVATEIILHVDDEKGGPFAKSAALAVSGELVDFLVMFGEEFIPDPFRHFTLSLQF